MAKHDSTQPRSHTGAGKLDPKAAVTVRRPLTTVRTNECASGPSAAGQQQEPKRRRTPRGRLGCTALPCPKVRVWKIFNAGPPMYPPPACVAGSGLFDSVFSRRPLAYTLASRPSVWACAETHVGSRVAGPANALTHPSEPSGLLPPSPRYGSKLRLRAAVEGTLRCGRYACCANAVFWRFSSSSASPCV